MKRRLLRVVTAVQLLLLPTLTFAGNSPGNLSKEKLKPDNPTVTVDEIFNRKVGPDLSENESGYKNLETILHNAGKLSLNHLNENFTTPPGTANAGPDKSVCKGSCVQIGTPAVSGNTYSWFPTTGLDNPNIAQPTACPNSNITYTLSVTRYGTCSTDQVIVTVNPKPTVHITGDHNICEGETAEMTANGAQTYQWLPVGTFGGSGSQSVSVWTPEHTLYTVVGTDANGCKDTAQHHVNVHPRPDVNAGPDYTFCGSPNGQSFTIGEPHQNGVNYSWSPTTGLSHSHHSQVTATPTGNTSYILTVHHGFCYNSDTVNFTYVSSTPANAGPDVSICAGSSAVIGTTAVAGNTYSWSPSTGLSATNTAQVTASPSVTTTYTLTKTNGPCTSTDQVTVTVKPNPTANAGADATICTGSSVTIGTPAIAGHTYSWSPSTGLSSTTSAQVTASPTTTTTYTLTVTKNGCVKTDMVTVNVNPSPNVTVVCGAPICPGGSTTLTASGAATYSWSPSTGLSATTGATVTASPSTSTLYTVTGTSAAGCTGTASVVVNVYSNPIANAGADATICAGGSATIGTAAVAGNTYSWSPATGLSSTTSAQVTANPSVTTTYTLTVNNGNCTSTDQVTVTVNPNPVANAGADASICVGGSATIGTAAVAGTTYSWSPSTGLSSTTAAQVTANPTVTTTYTLTATKNGCTSTDQVTVSVNANPIANAGADATICVGGSANLGIAAVAGNTYSWSPAAGLSSTTSAQVTANPSVTTTYTLTVTNGNCVSSDQVTVTVNPNPVANAGADATICAGGSAIIGTAAVAGTTYSWSPSAGLSSTTSAQVTANPSVTTTYTLTATKNGCTSTDQVTVNVNPLPNANAGADVTICTGGSANLGAAAVAGNTYSWSPSAGLSSTTSAQVTANPSATTTYTLTVTSGNCTSTDQVTVSVIANPTANAGADASICAGGNTMIGAAAVAGNTYSWSPAAGLSSTTSAQVTANPSATTTYTLTVTNGNCVSTDQVTVTVNANPIANAGADANICIGGSANLGVAAVAGTTYSWNPATGLSSTTSAQVTASPSVTTTYTLTATKNGCSSTDQVTVTVTANPIANAGADASICAGGNTMIGSAAVAGNTYSWSPAAGLSSTTSAQVTANPAVTTTYTLTVTNGNCTSTDQVTVTVNPNPVVTINCSQTHICAGGSVELTANGAATYAWSPAAGLSATTGATVTASPAATTTYTVVGTSANGCTASASITVTVSPNPIANAGADASICIGGSANLGVAAVAGTTYSWSPATGLSSTTSAQVTANPSVTTTYTLTATKNGCTSTDQVTVSVIANPTANAGADASICAGGNTMIGSAAVAGNTYSWSPAAGLSSTTSAQVTANPTVTTTYTLTVTNGNCTSTDQVTVTVNPNPVANAGADASICAGGSANLGVTAAIGASYSWSPAAGLSSVTSAQVIANPSATTTYTLTVTLGNCTSTDQVTVTVNANPIADAGADANICVGGSANLGAAAVAGNTYSWSPAAGLSSTTSAQVIANPSATTTYTLTVTSGNCTSADQVTVTVNANPIANAGADASICTGGNVMIGSAAVAGNTYSWSPAAGLSSTTSAQVTANPSATTTYTLTVTSGNCTSTDQVTVTVNPNPIANAGADANICIGGSATIGTAAVAGNTYSWSPALGLSSTTSAQVTANPLITTTYTLTVTGAGGCTSTDQVTVNVNANPVVTINCPQFICAGGEATLTASGAASYSWSPAAGLSATVGATVTASPLTTTTYTVVGTSADGCTATASVTLIVQPLPVVNAGVNVSICAGGSATLGVPAIPGISYSWSPATGLSSTTSAQVTASPSVTTTYTLTATLGNCSASAQVTVTVNTNPIADAGADASICAGGSANLGVAAVAGNTYSWSPAAGLSSTTSAQVTANPSVTTTYTLTVTNGSCTSSDQVTVTVTANPIADAGADAEICAGASANLGVAAVAGNTYSWSPAAGLSSATSAQVTANPSVTTTYTLTVTNGNCVSSDQVTVTVNALPNANAGADVAICEGGSTNLGVAANAGFSYSWSPATGLNLTTTALVTANPLVTTTYTLTVTENATGCSASDEVTVTVNPAPMVDAGDDIEICAGIPALIGMAPVAGVSYSWSPATGLSTSGAATVSANPSVTTQYILIATIGNCSASDTITVTVNPAPIANAGADVNICAGGSALIGSAAVAGNVYLWSPAIGLSSATSAQVTANPSVTTSYVLTVTNGDCVSTDTVIVNVHPNPVADAGPDAFVCIGANTGVMIGTPAVAGVSYSWSPAAGLSVTNVAQPTANPLLTTHYILTVSMNGCSDTDTVKVIAHPLPTADAGADVTVCVGGSAQIGMTAVPGDFYSWSPAAGLSDPNISNPIASPSVTTTYVLTVGMCGCFNYDTITVTVIPSVVANAGADITVCGSNGIMIGAAAQAGLTYSWSPAAGLSNANIAQPIANPSVNTNYILTVSNGSCSDTDTISVNVSPAPDANAGADVIVCGGNGVMIGAAAQAGLTYSWSPAAGLSNANIAQPIANPSVNTNYILTVSNGDCENTDTVSVIVSPAPDADAGPDAFVCIGANAGVMIGTPAVAGVSYSWSPAAGLSVTNVAQPTANPLVTTDYILTVSINGCTDTDTVRVIAHPLPAANAGADVTVCAGGNAQIGMTAVPGDFYSWSPAAGLSDPNISNPIASPSVTTTYILTVGMCGCFNYDTITVTVNGNPIANAGADVNICAGDGASIGVTAVAGATYSWSPATGLNDANAAQPIATPLVTTTYVLTVSNGSCVDSDTVVINVSPLPVADAGNGAGNDSLIICEGDAIMIGTPAIAGNTYTWTPSVGLSATTSAQVNASPAVTTSYILMVSNGSCVSSDTIVIVVNDAVEVNAGADVTVCGGNGVVLTATAQGATTFSWSPAAGLSNANILQPVANPSVTTTYILTASNGNCSSSDTLIVNVNGGVQADAGADVTVCAGNGIMLGAAAQAGITYSWSPAAGLSNANIAQPIANPSVNTTYILTISNGTCTDADTVFVSVNGGVQADAGANKTFCGNNGVILGAAAQAGNTYSWSPAAGLSNANIAQPIATPLVNTTYILTVSNGDCTDSDTVLVNVNGGVQADAGADVTVCGSNGVIIGAAAQAGNTYSWSPAAGLSNANIAQPIATPLVNTTYILTVSNGSCSDADTVFVSVNGGVQANAGADVTVCGSNGVIIGAAAQAGNTYSWSPAAGLSNANIAQPIASPLVNTTYILTVTNGDCSDSDTVNVTVGPDPIADAGDDVIHICEAGNVLLGNAPVAGLTYHWSPVAGLSSSNSAQVTATVTANATYILTVSNGVCTDDDTVSIILNGGVTADAGADIELCADESGTIGTTAQAGITYSWSPADGLSNANIAQPIVSADSSTTYILTVTNGQCTATDTVHVTVNPPVSVDAGADMTVCFGTFSLIGNEPAVPGVWYEWSPGDGISSIYVAQPTFSPQTNANYVQQYILNASVGDCMVSDTISITVVPAVVADAGADDVYICSNGSVTLGTTAIAGNVYSWSPIAGLDDANIAQPIASPNVTTTYVLHITNPNGCTSSDTVTVHVNSAAAIADAGPDQTVCHGAGAVIGTPAIPGFTYFWEPSVVLSSDTVAQPSVITNSTATYILTVTDSGGCSATDTVIITVNVLPNADAGLDLSLCAGEAIIIGTAATAGHSYSWSPATGLSSATIAQPLASPAATTTYTLTVTDDVTGCQGTDEVIVSMNTMAEANAGADAVICEGNSIQIGVPNISPASFSWSPATGLSNPNIPAPMASPIVTTTYILTVTNGNCVDSDTITIVVNPAPVVNAGPDQTICAGNATLIGLPAMDGISYSWSPAAGLSNPTIAQPTASPAITTVYTLTVNNGVCSNSANVAINVNPVPSAYVGPDQVICNGATCRIGGASVSGNTYRWVPSTGLNSDIHSQALATPEGSIVYTLTETDTVTGCFRIAEVRITVEGSDGFFNAFSPNGDEKNDWWNIPMLNCYPNNEVTIVNRWGAEVWKSQNYDNKKVMWTGENMNGEDMPDGTYYYILKYNDIEKRGWVFIKR